MFQVFELPPGVYETAEIIKFLPTSMSIHSDEVRI